MERSSVVVFISAGLLSPKKRDHHLARRQLYLNYGALSLATKLGIAGYDTLLVHGEHECPELVLARLIDGRMLPSKYPVMLSVPSFYALPWAQELCRLIKILDPASTIVVGGRWVVGPDLAWIKEKLPQAEAFAPGLSEPFIERLLTSIPQMNKQSVPRPDFPLDHTLVEDFLKYQPSVEASRGCGMGCGFCEERDIKIEKLSEASKLVRSMQSVQHQYQGGEIRPYLQASMFLPTIRWADDFANEVQRANVKIDWRTETRVDVMAEEALGALARAGLKVLDLGLESASPRQIIAMNKSKRPERYLERASGLLRACARYGVKAKVNVLLYPGESMATVAETTAWLDDHKSCISGVSVGPVVAYGPPSISRCLIQEFSHLGGSPVDENSSVETGITAINLSSEIGAGEAEALSLDISRRYMDADSYFGLKSFSYYPRDYTRADFDSDVSISKVSSLPFQLA